MWPPAIASTAAATGVPQPHVPPNVSTEHIQAILASPALVAQLRAALSSA